MPAHLRVAQEVVELDPADCGVSLEVGELVSQQKSRHGWLCSAGPAQKERKRYDLTAWPKAIRST